MKDKFASSDLTESIKFEVRSSQPPSEWELISKNIAIRTQKPNNSNSIVLLFVRVSADFSNAIANAVPTLIQRLPGILQKINKIKSVLKDKFASSDLTESIKFEVRSSH